MAEVSSIAYISLNQLNDPTAINLLEAGDTIASSILPENVRNAASGFDVASATLKAEIDDVSGDLNTVSAVVDGLSVGAANIPSNVSGAWQEGYQYVFDNSANIEDASSTINTFSGNVETSVVTLNNSLVAGAIGLSNLTTSTNDLSGFVDQVSGAVDDLRASSADLSAAIDYVSANAGGGPGTIDSGVSGPWQEATDFVNDSSANIINASSTFNTFSGNIETSANELSGFVDQVSGYVDLVEASANDISGFIDQVSSVVSTNTADISTNESDITSNRVEIDNVTGTSIPNLQSQITSNDGDITNLTASSSDLSGFIDQVSAVVAGNAGDITSNDTDITNLSGFVDQVSGAVDGSAASLQSQIDDILIDGVGVDSAVSGNWQETYTGWQSASANAIAGSDGYIAASADLITASSTFSTFSGNVETSVANLDSDITAVESDIANIEASTAALDGDVTNLSTALTGGYGGVVQDRLYYTAYDGTSGSVIANSPAEQLLRCTDPSTVTVYNFTSGTSAILEVSGELNACSVHVNEVIECDKSIIASGAPYPAPYSFGQINSVGATVNTASVDTGILHPAATASSFDINPNEIEFLSNSSGFYVSADGWYEVDANMVFSTGGVSVTYTLKAICNGVAKNSYVGHPQLNLETLEPVNIQAAFYAFSGDLINVVVNPSVNGQCQPGTTIKVRRIG